MENKYELGLFYIYVLHGYREGIKSDVLMQFPMGKS